MTARQIAFYGLSSNTLAGINFAKTLKVEYGSLFVEGKMEGVVASLMVFNSLVRERTATCKSTSAFRRVPCIF